MRQSNSLHSSIAPWPRLAKNVHSLCILALVALAIPMTAQDTKELVIRVSGESLTPNQYALTLEPGRIADRAIRVYSEPSHTLLALVIDTRFEQDAEYRTWREGFTSSGEPLATLKVTLPHTQPRVTIPPRPESDDVISVWIYGTWPDGGIEDRLISEAKVEGADFAISTYVPIGASDKL